MAMIFLGKKMQLELESLKTSLSQILKVNVSSNVITTRETSCDPNIANTPSFKSCHPDSSLETFDIGSICLPSLDFQTRKMISKTPHESFINQEIPISYKKIGEKFETRKITEKTQQKFQWLVLSRTKKGWYCLPCALVYNGQGAPDAVNNIRLGALVKEPLQNFNNLTGKHGTLQLHNVFDN